MCMCVYTGMHVCVYIYLLVYILICTYVCVYIFTSMYDVRVCISWYVFMYVFTGVHTHTHTHTRFTLPLPQAMHSGIFYSILFLSFSNTDYNPITRFHHHSIGYDLQFRKPPNRKPVVTLNIQYKANSPIAPN